jgi:hypothetical protein
MRTIAAVVGIAALSALSFLARPTPASAPLSFRADGPGRQRAVQYISRPEYPWAKLREQYPGRYESPVSPVPDPDGWFHVRIVVAGRAVRVFVDRGTTPTLMVDTLTGPRGGMVGLWVGNGSGGDFANLRIAPAD